MNGPDLINAAFITFGGAAIWANVARIRRDKMVRGVNMGSTLFFTAWGYWNLFFYAHLDQWFSTGAEVTIASGNTAWIYYMWRYRHA